MHILALLSPKAFCIIALKREFRIGIDKIKLIVFWENFDRIPDINFDHILGTPKNIVGFVYFKLFENVSNDSAKLIVPPEKIPPNSTKALSAMWDNGKYEKNLSDSSRGTILFKF